MSKALSKISAFVDKNDVPLLVILGMLIAAIPLILDGLLISGLFYTFSVGVVSMAMLLNHKKFVKLNEELRQTRLREEEYKTLAEKEASLAKKERENYLNSQKYADLWRGLMACRHVAFIGGLDINLPAGTKINQARAENHDYTHIAVEFWMTEHPNLAPLDSKLHLGVGKTILELFAKRCLEQRFKR